MRIWIEQKPRLNWGSDFTEELSEQLGPRFRPLEGPVVVSVRFIFYSAAPRDHIPVTQPSLRGLVNGLLDTLCGYVWRDEKQLVALHASKEYGNVSGVMISW